MNAAALLLAPALAVLGQLPIDGDTLVYSDGTRVKGAVVEVTFVADGTSATHAREVIAAIALSSDGPDVLLLRPGGVRKGKVTAVRFQTPKGGVVAVAREQMRSIVLSATNPSAPKPSEPRESPKPPPPKDEPSDDAKDARSKALNAVWVLRNRYWDKVGELKKKDFEALKAAWMGDAVSAQREIDSARKRIDDKLRRRREADARWQRERNEARRRRTEGQRWREPPRPRHNDGLENDQKALREAESRKRKLQKTISGEKAKISKSATTTRRRVESIYARFKKAIQGGQSFALDEVHKRYQAALDAHQPYQKGR